MRAGAAVLWGAVAVVTMAPAASGCSAVPYSPGPSLEPSQSWGVGGQAQTPPSSSGSRADFEFTGTLTSAEGLSAQIHSQLWLKNATTSPLLSRPRPGGWTNLHLVMTGSTTVTNTSDQPNPAAAAVFIEYNVAYPSDSQVCRLMKVPEQTDNIAGGYCWQQIGVATPFSYKQGPPIQLQPGQSQTVGLGEPAGVSVDVPQIDLEKVTRALRRPSRLVATTNDIAGLGASFRFRHACFDLTRGPTPPAGPAKQGREQHVVVGTTGPITCRVLPQLGH